MYSIPSSIGLGDVEDARVTYISSRALRIIQGGLGVWSRGYDTYWLIDVYGDKGNHPKQEDV